MKMCILAVSRQESTVSFPQSNLFLGWYSDTNGYTAVLFWGANHLELVQTRKLRAQSSTSLFSRQKAAATAPWSPQATHTSDGLVINSGVVKPFMFDNLLE